VLGVECCAGITKMKKAQRKWKVIENSKAAENEKFSTNVLVGWGLVR